jgi:hypothetical protein
MSETSINFLLHHLSILFSVREMCGAEDINTAFRHFRAFFQEFTSIDGQFRMDM